MVYFDTFRVTSTSDFMSRDALSLSFFSNQLQGMNLALRSESVLCVCVRVHGVCVCVCGMCGCGGVCLGEKKRW